MHRDIDPTLLRAFMTVAETGGMTAAARALNLTQAAVSQQIRRLEDTLAVQLFDRTAKQVRLTLDGDVLLGHARRLIALNDEIVGLMSTADEPSEVRFGVPCDLVGPYLPPILRSFTQSYPRARLTVVSETTRNLLRRLAAGEVDLALGTGLTAAPGSDCLQTQPLVWAGARGGRTWRQRPLPLAVCDPTCAFLAVATPALTQHNIDYRLLSERGECVATAMVEADLAITFVLAAAVPKQLDILSKDSGLPQLPDFHINLHWPTHGSPGSNNPLVPKLAEHIRDQFAFRFRAAA